MIQLLGNGCLASHSNKTTRALFCFLDDYLSSLVSLLPVYHEYIRNHSSALKVGY